jgi:hypothetical protein
MAIWQRKDIHSSRLLRRLKRPLEHIELKDLPNQCCSTGDCRSQEYWSVDCAQDALLKMEQDDEPRPVQLFTFSSRGVGIITGADLRIEQGAEAELITQAHGAGCSYRKVRCCWHRPHPQNKDLQCIGLRFDVDT